MWTPDPAHIVTAEAKASALAAAAANDQRRADLASDAVGAALRDRLAAATPAQIDAYVDANLKTLSDARAMFKALLRLIGAAL